MWGFQQNFQWWMPFFGMGMMLFWIVVIGLVIWGITRFMNSKRQRWDTSESSMTILRSRLARGDITREQFEELEETLQGGR